MTQREEVVPLKEAREQVEIAITRAALLHLSFSRTLIDELGEEKGKGLILKSIMEYGKRVGERIKRGLPDLPKYGVNGGWKDGKVYDCVFANIFREYGELDLGCFYCYIDPAKSMAADPATKFIHRDCAACGDDFCTFDKTSTTEKERKDFTDKNENWKHVDPRLAEGTKKIH
jgi:hypothetical protein